MISNIFLLLQAIAIGFVVAAPVGAVGAICIRRSLHGRRFEALLCGLGSAIADGVFAAVAALGLSLVIDWLEEHHGELSLVGGVFLLGYGIYMIVHAKSLMRSQEVQADSDEDDVGPWTLKGLADRAGMVFTGFGLTIINPATFLGFMGAFAGLKVLGPTGSAETLATGTTLVLGVAAGSTLWWIVLIAGASAVRRNVSRNILVQINRVLGGIVAVVGVGAIFQLF
jgi:threonine/homoserine/homoserine lactone efflux protein